MKNIEKKDIIKFAIFAAAFVSLSIIINLVAGRIMDAQYLSARSVMGSCFGAFVFGYGLFFRKKITSSGKSDSQKTTMDHLK